MTAVRILAVLVLAACASKSDASSTARDSAAARTDSAPNVTAVANGATVITAPAGAAAESTPADSTAPAAVADTGAARAAADTTKAKPAAPKPAFAVQPAPGALLPGHRIVAYYGNPLSKRMGILGQIPKDEMLARLEQESKGWAAADPATPVMPALHVIVTVAQGAAGRDGMWRTRMPDTLIKTVKGWADSKKYLTFLDVQVGHSTVQQELPRLEQYLADPKVHLAIDPEFSMKDGTPPGRKVGNMTAGDVNFAIKLLDDVVTKNKLPPKILVVHRFRESMLKGYRDIRPTPNVQVVIDMDGFGPPSLKRDSYKAYVTLQPVQYSGFKLFYKNDKPMLTKKQVVGLEPSPLYIQYQ